MPLRSSGFGVGGGGAGGTGAGGVGLRAPRAPFAAFGPPVGVGVVCAADAEARGRRRESGRPLGFGSVEATTTGAEALVRGGRSFRPGGSGSPSLDPARGGVVVARAYFAK